MALTLEEAGLTKRRAFNVDMSHESNRKLKALFETLSQIRGNPKLQLVAFAELTDTETIVADVAAKLYALFLKKDTATATFSKVTDHATTSSDAASELRFKSARIGDGALARKRCNPPG
jgi:hypothetical protein